VTRSEREPAPHELPWEPITPQEAASLFDSWGRFWCVAGGWAIDLWLGRTTRHHGDIDLQILRRDAAALPSHLAGWDLHLASATRSLPLWVPEEPLPAEVHNLWCRPVGAHTWRLQVLVMDHDADRWIYRRNEKIAGSLTTLSTRASGIPVIAPEIQLLFKSRDPRTKDEADFHAALPDLTPAQRSWLHDALASSEPDHPWLSLLDSTAS
jgi:hypothetical protein